MASGGESAEVRPEDCSLFRLVRAVKDVAPLALSYPLRWGTNKPDDITYHQYIKDVLKLPEHQKNEAGFSQPEREKLKNSLDPTGFDVNLMAKLIRLCCTGVAPLKDPVWRTSDDKSLEGIVMRVKKLRNDFFHLSLDKDLMILINDLEVACLQTIQLAGTKYSIAVEEIRSAKEDIFKNLESIKNTPLSESEIPLAKMEVLSQELKRIVATKGKDEIKSLISKWCYLEPLHVYGGDNRQVDVASVYTPIKVASDPSTFLDYTDVLTVPHVTRRDWSQSTQLDSIQSDSLKNITIIQGAAGSGKTTLLKLIGAVYIDASSHTIKGLSEYDLLLYTECRDSHLESIEDFLVRTFKSTSQDMERKDLVKTVLSFKLLILVDGLDELNSKSTALFTDLLEKTRDVDATIICTTRPTTNQWIRSLIPEGYDFCSVSLTEINEEHRLEFLMKYYRQITYLPDGKKDLEIPQDLIDSFERISERTEVICRYPINLVMLCILYLHDSEKLKEITSGTSLYEQVMTMYEKKISRTILAKSLEERVSPKQNLDEGIKEAMCAICQDALRALSRDEIYLSLDSYEELKKVCTNKNLCIEPIISALLVFKSSPFDESASSNNDEAKVHCFPHKGFQDFYAAKAIVQELESSPLDKINELSRFLETTEISDAALKVKLHEELSELRRNEISDVKSTLIRLTREKPTSLQLQKYQNVLLHVIGLLLKDTQLFEQFGKEAVNLLEDAGVTNLHQWLEVILESNCDDRLVALVAPKTSSSEWRLSDGDLKAATALLNHTAPKLVRLDLHSVPARLKKTLPDILRALSKHGECKLYLKVNHSFNEPQEDCDDHIRPIADPSFNCQLEQFKGSLLDTSLLHKHNQSLDWMRVVLIDPSVHQLGHITNLRTLNVKVFAGSPIPAAHLPLPASTAAPAIGAAGFGVHLLLAEVTDQHVQWALDLLVKLHPVQPYARVILSRCCLSEDGLLQLAHGIRTREVRICLRLDLHSTTLMLTEQQKSQCQEDIRCPLLVSSGADQLVVGMSDPATHALAHLPNSTQHDLVVYVQRAARLPDRPRPLPAVDRLTLRLWSAAGPNGCEWIANMTEALHPPHPYYELQLRDCLLDASELELLLTSLAERKVRVSGQIVVYSDDLLLTDALTTLCRRRLHCLLQRVDKVHKPT